MKQRNKQRLYVVLFLRQGKEGDPLRKYHWALSWGPKSEKNTMSQLWDAKDTAQPGYPLGTWRRVEKEVESGKTIGSAVARIMIAKIVDIARMEAAIRNVELVQGNPAWTCRIWVKDALDAIAAKEKVYLVSPVDLTDWDGIEKVCRWYADGLVDAGMFGKGSTADLTYIATLDMTKGVTLS